MSVILIVEDNPVNLKLVRDLLVGKGHEVVSASTAEEGIRLAHERPPALIVMDVQLPGLDGLSATRQLKESPTLSRIPVIAVTANAMVGDEALALAAGCVHYLTKPIRYKEFLAVVDSVLSAAPPA